MERCCEVTDTSFVTESDFSGSAASCSRFHVTLDAGEKRFILNIAKERLENAPGFDKDHWPSMADSSWATEIHAYYDIRPYWDEPLVDDTSIYGRERDPRTTAGSINPKSY